MSFLSSPRETKENAVGAAVISLISPLLTDLSHGFELRKLNDVTAFVVMPIALS